MATAKYVQCNYCGLYFVEFDTVRVQHGRRINHYCRECTHKMLKLNMNAVYGKIANECLKEGK